MHRLVTLIAVVAMLSIPVRSEDSPEARVAEFARSAFAEISIVPIPCDENLLARVADAGLGLWCARSVAGFDDFRDAWQQALDRSAEPFGVLTPGPWDEAGPGRIRLHMLDDLPFVILFLEPEKDVVINFPGTTMWNEGKRSIADLMRALSSSLTSRPAPQHAATPRPETPPYLAGVQGVSNPQVIPDSRVLPHYPKEARRDGLEATVVLQALVLVNGTIEELTVVRCTTPDSGFEKAAIDAVRQWRYEPALLQGQPVDVYFTVSVRFALD